MQLTLDINHLIGNKLQTDQKLVDTLKTCLIFKQSFLIQNTVSNFLQILRWLSSDLDQRGDKS